QRLDALSEANVHGLERDQRVFRLRLAAQQPLRERRPVVRPVRVLRPEDDVVPPAGLAVALDSLCGGQAASDDPDHLASCKRISLRCSSLAAEWISKRSGRGSTTRATGAGGTATPSRSSATTAAPRAEPSGSPETSTGRPSTSARIC